MKLFTLLLSVNDSSACACPSKKCIGIKTVLMKPNGALEWIALYEGLISLWGYKENNKLRV
jgi:hypothetical protein